MSFLLPDRSLDDDFNANNESAQEYGAALFDIFRAWMTEDDPRIQVRFVWDILRHFQFRADEPARSDAGTEVLDSIPRSTRYARQVIVAHSDGRVGVSDSYIPALAWFRQTPEFSVRETTLHEFLANDIFKEIETSSAMLPARCSQCEWRRICRGGDLENRYSGRNGFDNASVYCDGYKWFFNNMRRMLVNNGYPADRLQSVLDGAGLI